MCGITNSSYRKAFHKNAKTCRAGFHKKATKQDGTHMTIRSQIRIVGLVCGLGCALKGVESKVIVVPWVSSCMGFVPEGSSMSSRGRSPRVQIQYSIVQVTCAIALL